MKSNKPVSHEQPCHVHSHFNHFSPSLWCSDWTAADRLSLVYMPKFIAAIFVSCCQICVDEQWPVNVYHWLSELTGPSCYDSHLFVCVKSIFPIVSEREEGRVCAECNDLFLLFINYIWLQPKWTSTQRWCFWERGQHFRWSWGTWVERWSISGMCRCTGTILSSYTQDVSLCR